MVSTQSLLADKVSGSIYGLFVGDALGCPIEGWSPKDIITQYGQLTEMEESNKRWRPRGLHSDDGQQAMALCDALLLTPEDPSEEMARIFVELLLHGSVSRRTFGLHRGTGRNFRKCVRLLANNCPPREAAQPSAGNGVAMMIAPASLFWRDAEKDEEALIRCVLQVGLVKQKDIRGIAAAGAVAYLCQQALSIFSFDEISPRAFLSFVRRVEDRAAAILGHHEHHETFSQALKAMLGNLHLSRPEALANIERRANQSSNRRVGVAGGYALASVITSIYMALTAHSFEQGLIDTVNLGGDADTTGAMVGAMLGALRGRGAIPERWYQALVAKDAFEDRVEALLRKETPWRAKASLLSLEIPWTGLMRRK